MTPTEQNRHLRGALEVVYSKSVRALEQAESYDELEKRLEEIKEHAWDALCRME